MPRSPLRAPSPSVDYWQRLLIFREPVAGNESQPPIDTEPDARSVPDTITSQSVFGNNHPLEVEVGSGKGLFLTNQSKAYPQRNFVGIEIVHKYARHSAARLAKSDCQNAMMISGNAERLFANRIPPGSLEAVHVYFPDPWWKKRHRKRRVVNETSVQNYFAALRPGGRFHFWTDVLDYFEATIEMIAEIVPNSVCRFPRTSARRRTTSTTRPTSNDAVGKTGFLSIEFGTKNG